MNRSRIPIGASQDHRPFSFVLLILILAAFACNSPGTHPTLPTVEIQAPTTGTIVPVNEPVLIASVASDPNGPGISHIELFVNGESIRIDESVTGAQEIFDIAQVWTPTEEGQATVTVVAYREDGTSSAPATITLIVAGMTPDPAQIGTPGFPVLPTTSPRPSPSPSPAIEIVQGETTTEATVRSGPGPFCSILGFVPRGEVINLLELSKDKLWYKTDYLGPNESGWISKGAVKSLGDTSLIPVVNRTGCMGCGDGDCNLAETCDTCPEDCGECCGNGSCEPEYGEDCGTCEADCGPCCGNGVCEPGRGEDCGTCTVDCGPCCGNGVCEPGRKENCSTCEVDCGKCCGNKLCEPQYGETCETCPADCGACCGNGLCEADRGEDCATCPTDCGACCGNGLCEAGRGEDCATCPTDCGACP